MIISKKPNFFKKIKLKLFKQKYINRYPDYLQEEINLKLYNGYTNNNDIVNQIYCYLNLIDDKINNYKHFIKIIEEDFSLDNKVLEVGAGTIPILAKYLEEKRANINIIDPNIIFDDLIKGKIIKETFTIKTNIENYDLIIGYNPCKATEDIIRNAIKKKKDFCIALCGCCFLPDEYENRTPELWHSYLFELAKKLSNDKYELKVKYFDKILHISDPVIIGKYKN